MKFFIIISLFVNFVFASVSFDATTNTFQGMFTLDAFFSAVVISVLAISIISAINLAIRSFSGSSSIYESHYQRNSETDL